MRLFEPGGEGEMAGGSAAKALVASLLLVVRPGAPSGFLLLVSTLQMESFGLSWPLSFMAFAQEIMKTSGVEWTMMFQAWTLDAGRLEAIAIIKFPPKSRNHMNSA